MRVAALVAAALVALAAAGAGAQERAIFDCGSADGPGIVVGQEAPAGCQRVDQDDLRLAPAETDLEDLAQRLADQEARLDRLEREILRLLTPRVGMPRATPRPIGRDPYDTGGRLRDLGQDIDRKLDALGR